jgi:hypothetical protein
MLHLAASCPMSNAAEFERWFAADTGAFNGSTDPADSPPLDDTDAQRYWLGGFGFGAAWAECPWARSVVGARGRRPHKFPITATNASSALIATQPLAGFLTNGEIADYTFKQGN